MIKIAPSILSADFGCLEKEIKEVEACGVEMLHIDVMDGHFVPNITIGPPVIKCIRKITRLPLDVHLMIESPERLIDDFLDAGSDMLTMHIETIRKAELRTKNLELRKRGIKVGVSLNPDTPLTNLNGVLDTVDFVLVMSVNPGFGGQKFMPQALPKIKELRDIFEGDISVDGGINDETAAQVIKAGANILACGSYIFKAADKKSAIERIRNAGE